MNHSALIAWALFLLVGATGSASFSAEPRKITSKQVAAEDSKSDATLTVLRLQNVSYALSIPTRYFSGSQSAYLAGKEISQIEFALFLPKFEVGWLGAPTYETRPREGSEKRIDVMAVRGQAKFIVKDGKNIPIDPHYTLKYILASYKVIQEKYGLKCYALKTYTGPVKNVSLPCIGTRANGELLVLYGGDTEDPTRCRFSCDVYYYSDQAQLYINYRYDRVNVSRWREIDDAMWANLNSWRAK